jgi:molybdenum storage protein
MADVLGFRQAIYIKDERGLYDKDPKRHADAKFIARTTLAEVLAHPPETNILDEALFHSWKQAKNLATVRIINGLERGNLLGALRGDDSVGTVITREAV